MKYKYWTYRNNGYKILCVRVGGAMTERFVQNQAVITNLTDNGEKPTACTLLFIG